VEPNDEMTQKLFRFPPFIIPSQKEPLTLKDETTARVAKKQVAKTLEEIQRSFTKRGLKQVRFSLYKKINS